MEVMIFFTPWPQVNTDSLDPGITRKLSCYLEGMDKLDTLAMNHNLLTNIKEGNFEGMPRLTSLALDNNKIQHIHLEAFRALEGTSDVRY